MYICSFLSANTNTNRNAFEKNKKIQIRVKILPQNVFENTNTNTFHSFFRDFTSQYSERFPELVKYFSELVFLKLNELFM